jgi:hypothetical protein
MNISELVNALKNYELKELISTSEQSANTIASELNNAIVVAGQPFTDSSGISKVLFRVILIKEKN